MGKPDGFGTYSYYEKSQSGARGPFVWESTVTMVKGKRFGMWCDAPKKGVAKVTGLRRCGFIISERGFAPYFVEREAGQWIISDSDWVPVWPATRVMPGALERESAKLVENARLGIPIAQIRLETETPAFSDLVKGGQFAFLLDTNLPDMRSKRVAVVLSSNTIAELERYAEMRLELIAISARAPKIKEKGPYSLSTMRDNFVSQSAPRNLVAGLVAGLRPHVLDVIAAEDLSILVDGRADYVLLMDWKFAGNFALASKKYQQLPVCTDEEKKNNNCYVLFAPSFSLRLIDKQRQVVRLNNSIPYPLVYYFDQSASYDWLFHTLSVSIDGLLNIDSGAIRKHSEKLVSSGGGI